jgi:NADPH-dependent 2,4-dienoyl-CoA reductase/sulfur reductase-like enzyme/rhodanese-related sulfurtransferase
MKRVVIVGGVAGGASAAARLRRLDEQNSIILFERGPYISYSNCGMPYRIGGIIEDDHELLLQTPQSFHRRFNVEVRVGEEALAIDRSKRMVQVRRLASGEEYEEPYDLLLLSPGATPIKPPIPNIDHPKVLTLRDIPDMQHIMASLPPSPGHISIIGAGFIGLELLENLHRLGHAVTVWEMLPQVLPVLDAEMTAGLAKELRKQGVILHLGSAVAGLEPLPDGNLIVSNQRGESEEAQLVILAVGVKPEVKLAKECGLEIGALGGIRTNDRMQTSDPAIYAVGDAVEVTHLVTGKPALLALAGPAQRQARVAADNIAGMDSHFPGVIGTSVIKLFNTEVASTGANEALLKREGIAYRKLYCHWEDHAEYYPGATTIKLKLLYDHESGRILGAQAGGQNGVARRIDIIASYIKMGGTTADLAQGEFCYSPQVGTAKDIVNIAGFIAENDRAGIDPLVQWSDWQPGWQDDPTKPFVLDVRTPGEYARGHVPGAPNIPVNDLRERMKEIPSGRIIWVYCRVGQRAHTAIRMLRAHGYDAYNVSGSIYTFRDSYPNLVEK